MNIRKKILLIEDEPNMIELVTMRLEANGYEVISAIDGEKGFIMAKSEGPDLIILDLMLPKLDGYKVCGMLKEDSRYQKIPIIILTGRAQKEDILLGEEVGCDAYIKKPFEPQMLLMKIEELIERGV